MCPDRHSSIDIAAQKNKELAYLESKRLLEAFLQISQTITSTLGQRQIMQLVIDNATSVMGFDSGAIYMVEAQNNILLSATTPPLPSDFPEEFRLATIDDHPHIRRALKTGKPIFLADTTRAKLSEQEKEIVKIRNLRSNLYLPIMLRGQAIGILILSSVGRKYVIASEKLTLLQGFAYQAAHIIDNARNIEGLKKYAWELEKQIAERLQTEAELIIAKEMAQESDRLKSAFLANMSHEIRTPMNSILGFSELLKNPQLTGDQKYKYIDTIQKSGRRMLNLINDIVNISKIEAGQVEYAASSINIRESMQYMFDLFKPEFDKLNPDVQFRLNIPAGDIIILTDREKLHSVLLNLISNALKFTKTGYVELGLERESDKLKFYVKDSGIGIPVEVQQKVFDRFYQADISLTRGHEGSGLGLAITKAFVTLLGGNIWLESKPGKGTIFYVTLPYRHVLEHSI